MTANFDKPARQNLAHEIRRYLAGEQSAFEFDKAIFAIHDDTHDKTIRTISQQLWLCYDDCQDHFVALSKLDWDYIQRLILVLEANRRLEQCCTRHWHWTQLIALAALLGFTACACCFGVGEQLLAFSIPFGLISMVISWWRERLSPRRDKPKEALTPFASFAELRAAVRAVPNFHKAKYRPELLSVRIRSRLGELSAWLPAVAAWLMFAPIPLLFQCLPQRIVVTRVTCLDNRVCR